MNKFVAYTKKVEEELACLEISSEVTIDCNVVSSWLKDFTHNTFDCTIEDNVLNIRRLKASDFKVVIGEINSCLYLHVYGLINKMGIKSL